MKLILPICLLCLSFPQDQGAEKPRTVADILKANGLPLYVAKSVRVEPIPPKAKSGTNPDKAVRLVTTEYQVIESKEQAQKLTNVVLIYCTEPPRRKGWGELILGVHSFGLNMAKASPLMGYQGPLPLAEPFQFTLAHIGPNGQVTRTETHQVMELAHPSPPKK